MASRQWFSHQFIRRLRACSLFGVSGLLGGFVVLSSLSMAQEDFRPAAGDAGFGAAAAAVPGGWSPQDGKPALRSGVRAATPPPTQTAEPLTVSSGLGGVGRIELQIGKPKSGLPTYVVGEKLSFVVQPSQDMYVYCFYKPGDGHILRVFPNRYVPNPLVRQDQRLHVPDPRMKFDIVLDKSSPNDQLVCLGVKEKPPVERIGSVAQADLMPLKTYSMEQLIDEFATLYQGVFIRVDQQLTVIEGAEQDQTATIKPPPPRRHPPARYPDKGLVDQNDELM